MFNGKTIIINIKQKCMQKTAGMAIQCRYQPLPGPVLSAFSGLTVLKILYNRDQNVIVLLHFFPVACLPWSGPAGSVRQAADTKTVSELPLRRIQNEINHYFDRGFHHRCIGRRISGDRRQYNASTGKKECYEQIG